jgi:hypothetical protein
MPATTLKPMIANMRPAGSACATNTGIISSDVARMTETSVPADTTRAAYSVPAIAEKPHCGSAPSRAPTMGPDLSARAMMRSVRPPAACSSASIAR